MSRKNFGIDGALHGEPALALAAGNRIANL
ncbi:hypothetical protein GGR00_002423 [Aminobacter aganoensis]|uniref:Uncharacterized protein n=1 Tax=Aminobacter aganoensis TaxID=83264 RepID=A0A7X0F7N4_9HYPH|nr:hypothetical protein [Aminobacter aganoensis]